MTERYKKLAGTSAVFVSENYQGASPVERDGMIWTATELHLEAAAKELNWLPSMANGLALEGLEDYDPPKHGDARRVESLGVSLVYLENIRGWVQIADRVAG